MSIIKISLLPPVFMALAFSDESCFNHTYYGAIPVPAVKKTFNCKDLGILDDVFPVAKTSVNLALSQQHAKSFRKISYTTGCNPSMESFRYELSGWNVIALNRFYAADDGAVSIIKDGLVAELNEYNPIGLKEAEAIEVSGYFKSYQTVSYHKSSGKILASSTPSVLFLRKSYYTLFQTIPHGTSRVKTIYNPKRVIDYIKTTLGKNGWGKFSVGFIEVDGYYIPAVIKKFGVKKNVYAPYGYFNDNSLAKLYGYAAFQKLFYSKQRAVEPKKHPALEKGAYYGTTIYTEDDFSSRFDEIKDDIPWQGECRHSGMPYVSDDLYYPLASKDGKAYPSGEITPAAPDDIENSNALPLRTCPDKHFYWSLYVKCVEEIEREDEPVPDLTKRIDYRDYAKDYVMEKNAWEAFEYDGTINSEGFDPDDVPPAPAYYDKKGKRLNPNATDVVYDPFHPNTKFFGWGRKEVFGFDIDLSKDKKVKRNVTKQMRAILGEMKSFFESYIKPGRGSLIELFKGHPGFYINKPHYSLKHGRLELNLRLDDVQYFKEMWMFLNPSDKYLAYESPTSFIVHSSTGKPFKLWYDDYIRSLITIPVEDDEDYDVVYVKWWYTIFSKDKYGDPYKIGELHIKSFLQDNSFEANIVKKLSGELFTEGDKDHIIDGHDIYDLNSRKAKTDLKDFNERDEISFKDKTSALSNIAFKIAVSEGLDMAMKFLHQNRNKYYQAAKRIENWYGIRQTYKIAKSVYEAYSEWAKLMDILADVRDTYKDMQSASQRVKRASRMLFDHFTKFDYAGLRPNNIASIYPSRALSYFDYSTFMLKDAAVNFEFAVHALSFDVDRFTHGPGKIAISYAYNNIFNSLSKVKYENEKRRELNHAELKSSMHGAKKPNEASDYLRLSKYTAAVIQYTKQTKVTSLYSQSSGLRQALFAIQDDSRDWIRMRDYVTENLAGGPEAFISSVKKGDPEIIKKQFSVEPVFINPYLEKLADKTGDSKKAKN